MSGMKTEERRNVIGFISGQKWLASAYLQRSALHLNARPRVSLDSLNHCVGTAQSVRRNCFNGEQKQQLKLALWKVSTANWGWHRNTKESLTLPCSFHCPWWLWVCLRGATRLKKKKSPDRMCRHGLWIQRRDSLTFKSFNKPTRCRYICLLLTTFWGSGTTSGAAPVNFCLERHHSAAQHHRFRDFKRLTCTSGNSSFQHVPPFLRGKPCSCCVRLLSEGRIPLF